MRLCAACVAALAAVASPEARSVSKSRSSIARCFRANASSRSASMSALSALALARSRFVSARESTSDSTLAVKTAMSLSFAANADLLLFDKDCFNSFVSCSTWPCKDDTCSNNRSFCTCVSFSAIRSFSHSARCSAKRVEERPSSDVRVDVEADI